MIDKHTFLVHLSPNEELEDKDDEDEIMMLKLFLDTLMSNSSKLLMLECQKKSL